MTEYYGSSFPSLELVCRSNPFIAATVRSSLNSSNVIHRVYVAGTDSVESANGLHSAAKI